MAFFMQPKNIKIQTPYQTEGDKMEWYGVILIIGFICQTIFNLFFIVLMAVAKKTPIDTIDWSYY